MTFELLEFPYSKDKNYAYNGTIRIKVKNISEFRVTKPDGMQVNSALDHLIERNDELEWLSNSNVKYAIYGFGNWSKA